MKAFKNGHYYRNTAVVPDELIVAAISTAHVAYMTFKKARDDFDYMACATNHLCIHTRELVMDMLTCPAQDDVFNDDEAFTLISDYGHMPEECLRQLKSVYSEWFYEAEVK